MASHRHVEPHATAPARIDALWPPATEPGVVHCGAARSFSRAARSKWSTGSLFLSCGRECSSCAHRKTSTPDTTTRHVCDSKPDQVEGATRLRPLSAGPSATMSLPSADPQPEHDSIQLEFVSGTAPDGSPSSPHSHPLPGGDGRACYRASELSLVGIGEGAQHLGHSA